MSANSKVAVLGVFLILICCSSAASKPVFTRPPASEFNIELLNLDGPRYVGSVPGQGARSGYFVNRNLHRIATWKPSEEVPLEVSVLKVDFWLEEGAVRLEVQAYLGESPPYSRPADWEKLKKVKVASRLVHDGETISVKETERVGIEAFQVKVARAHPWSIGPPEVINKTQALTVVTTDEERPAYTVTVRNVSQKNVSAIQWYGRENERRVGGSGQQGNRLISANGVFQIHQRFALTEEKQNGGSGFEPSSKREIVIAAIIFDDGSFEGEPDLAAEMAAKWMGESIQVSRVTQLLQSVTLAAGEDPSTKLPKLKLDVAALGEDVDPAVAERVRLHFPGATEETLPRRIKTGIKVGLQLVKSDLLREIERFQYRRDRSPESADLQAWLKGIARRYGNLPAPY